MGLKSRIGWGILIGIFFLFWLYDVVVLIQEYTAYPIDHRKNWEMRAELPYPSPLLCLQKPIDEQKVSALSKLTQDQRTAFTKFFYGLIRPESDSAVANDPQTGLDAFNAYLTEYGKTKTHLESVLYNCTELVVKCSQGTKEFTPTECCKSSKYIATSVGLCLVSYAPGTQKGPGQQFGLNYQLRIDNYNVKGQNQGNMEGIELYLIDKNASEQLHSPGDAQMLISGSQYQMDVKMGRYQMLSRPYTDLDCADDGGTNEKEKKCSNEQVLKECKCIHILSIWKTTQQEASNFCLTEAQQSCVQKLQRKWEMDQTTGSEGGEGSNGLSCLGRPKDSCNKVFWDVKTQQRALPGQQVAGDLLDLGFRIFYNKLMVSIEEMHIRFTFAKLFKDIGLQACIWYVLYRLIYLIVHGIRICFNSKNRFQPTVQEQFPADSV